MCFNLDVGLLQLKHPCIHPFLGKCVFYVTKDTQTHCYQKQAFTKLTNYVNA